MFQRPVSVTVKTDAVSKKDGECRILALGAAGSSEVLVTSVSDANLGGKIMGRVGEPSVTAKSGVDRSDHLKVNACTAVKSLWT